MEDIINKPPDKKIPLEHNVDPIDILISKYEKAKRQQEDLRIITPLSNAVQHQLLDQNIHIFDGIVSDLHRLRNVADNIDITK